MSVFVLYRDAHSLLDRLPPKVSDRVVQTMDMETLLRWRSTGQEGCDMVNIRKKPPV